MEVLRPHYLLEVDTEQLIGAICRNASVPEWIEESLRASNWVVVRRGPSAGRNIPIGIRGAARNQRWAAFCPAGCVTRVIQPPQLLGRAVAAARSDAIPALRCLPILESLWRDRALTWGPGGSVGFELATGSPVTKAESDLDIVIYAEQRMTAREAKSLCDLATGLPAAVDIRVETNASGFALQEYANESPAPILLRVPGGAMLGADPWAIISAA